MFYFVNHFRSFVNRVLWGEVNSPSLFSEIKNSAQPVHFVNFGLLGGNVAFINPQELNMAQLLDTLDAEPQGRQGEMGLRFFVGGNFISTRAKDDEDYTALNHHYLLSGLLSRPAAFIENTQQSIHLYLNKHGQQSVSLLELATTPLRNSLARGLFDIEQIPPNLHQALQGFSDLVQDKLESFGKTLSVKLMTAYYSWLFYFIPQYQQAKQNYLAASEQFLAEQATAVITHFQELKQDNQKTLFNITNALARFIAQRIKETYPDLDSTELLDYLSCMTEQDLQPYLQEAYIKTLPVLPLPGDMIVIPACSAMTELAQNKALLLELRSELEKRNFKNKTAEERREDILHDKQNNGLLHRIFLEALRRDFQQKKPEDLEAETVILRYCEQGINLKNQKNEQVAQIPPQTMIAILNALPRFDPKIWPQPERFDPSRFENDEDKTREKTVLTIFSYGKRRCPANLITEFIFQTFIAELVMNYDLSLIHGDDLKQAEIELQPLVADLEQECKHLTSSQI